LLAPVRVEDEMAASQRQSAAHSKMRPTPTPTKPPCASSLVLVEVPEKMTRTIVMR